MKIKLLIILVVVMGCIGFYFYYQHNQQLVKQQEADYDRRSQIMLEKNKKYAQALMSLCNKKVQEITGVDFFRCEDVDNIIYTVFPGADIDMESSLADPNLPVFCNKKIGELTAIEFKDCLKEPDENN